MKFTRKLAAALMTAVMALSLAACGGDSAGEIKNIDKPKTAATEDEAKASALPQAIEDSGNVNGKRFDMDLKEFTERYNAEAKKLTKGSQLDYRRWKKTGKAEEDQNGVQIQYWHYDDEDVSFTATVETESFKLMNIGCGTTMSKFMGMTGEKNNSDIILEKAALMAQSACGFPTGSEPVLQSIFYRTTTENNDTLWFNGIVFHLSTQKDSSDSKNNIMLFRVFPITDALKAEWKLEEF